MIHGKRQLLVPLTLSLSLSCAHEPLKNEVDIDALVREAPDAAFVSGRAVGLGEPEVLNDKDFIYAVAFDGDADEVAFVHHVTANMELTLAPLDPPPQPEKKDGDEEGEQGPPKVFQQPINHHEYDVEDVEWVEAADKRFLLTPSRQGIVRRFQATDGALAGEFIYGEPNVRLAVSPSQKLVAVGSDGGRLLILDAETLAFRGEARPHEDEVRGIAFLDDERVMTVSFDGQLVVTRLEPGAPEMQKMAASKLDNGGAAFLAHLDGAKAVSATRDVRQPSHVITRAAVARLGLKPVLDGTTLPVVTSMGAETRPAVELGELQLRYFNLGVARAAVCDQCVPTGAEMVIGQPGLARIVLGDDFSTGEVIAKPGRTQGMPTAAPVASPTPTPTPTTVPAPEGETPAADGEAVAEGATPAAPATPAPAAPAASDKPATVIEGALKLVEVRRVKLPGPATDLDLDAHRKTAVIAYSHARAVRDPEIYDAEKKGNYPPPSPASGAVLVDLKTMELGRRLVGHKGFTVAAAISPDGRTVVTGGWDKRFIIFDAQTGQVIEDYKLAWLLRQVRFSGDGRLLAVAAWTPVNPFNDGASEPALIVYPVVFDDPTTAKKAPRVSTR